LETEQATINGTGNSAGEAGHHSSVAQQADETGSTFDTTREAWKTGNYQANPTHQTGDEAGPTLDSTSETRKAGNNPADAKTDKAGARCPRHATSETREAGNNATVAATDEAGARCPNHAASQAGSAGNASIARTNQTATEPRSANGTACEPGADEAKTRAFQSFHAASKTG
jgi:hypothetical protein